MSRIGLERRLAAAGLGFVVLFVTAFALGIDDVGGSDPQVAAYYADSGNRIKQVVAFALIASAALCLLAFAGGLRSLIARAENPPHALSAYVWGGGALTAGLLLAGNAVSRSVAIASYDEQFRLDPNVWRLTEDVGTLLFVSAALAAIVLVLAVSLADLRYGVLPRWIGWLGLGFALLLPFAFIGFLAFGVWILLVSATLARRKSAYAR